MVIEINKIGLWNMLVAPSVAGNKLDSSQIVGGKNVVKMFLVLKGANFSGWTRKLWLGRWKVLVFLTLFLVAFYSSLFVLPIRNVVLYYSLELAWKDVPTDVLFRIHFGDESPPQSIYTAVTCLNVNAPRVTKNDINTSAILTYPYLKSYDAQVRSLQKGHGRYLPVLNLTQKVDNLYLYKVAGEALDQVGVQHFLVAGSLLGLNRHGGFVPWDDDLDIAIGISHWQLVKQTLTCLRGFTLNRERDFHWKFSYANISYPFLDVFFYKSDDTYIWAATHYIRKTFIYPKTMVFPLAEEVFEGIRVPVPRDSLGVARRIYDYNECRAYSGHIPRDTSSIGQYPRGYSITQVPCRSLSYMYTMFYLQPTDQL